MVQGGGHRHHFLHKTDVQGLAQIDGAGAGDGHVQGACTQLFSCLPQKIRQGLLGVGQMTAVFAENDFFLFIQDDQLYSGRANVNACSVSFRHVEPPVRCGNNIYFLI